MNHPVKPVISLLSVLLLFLFGQAFGTENEQFVGEVDLIDDETETATISSHIGEAVSAVAAGTIVLAQTTDENSVTTESADADKEGQEDDVNEGLVDQYTLPRSSAPIAVETTLQSGTPIGRNTQQSLSRPPGAKIDASIGFFPILTLGYSWTDNPAREEGGGTSDASLRILPTITYRSAINNRHVYEVGITAGVENFDQFTNLDATTVIVHGAINLDISEKIQADIYGDHTEGNDPRGGTGSRILDEFDENDEFESDTYGGRLTIGRRSNTFQVVMKAEQSDIEFTNNGQEHRDRGDTTYGVGLYWNVGPKTSIFLNNRNTDIDYVDPLQSGFDSEETSNTIGIGWEPTYNTSLVFEIGNLEKDMSDPTFTDYDDTTYSGRARWSPTNRANIGLYASKTTEESTEFEAPYIVSDLIGIDFGYSFTERFRGRGFFNMIEDDVVNARQDEITEFGIGVFYDLTRWLTMGADWHHGERESTDPVAAYEVNTYSVTATLRANKKAGFESLQTGKDLTQ